MMKFFTIFLLIISITINGLADDNPIPQVLRPDLPAQKIIPSNERGTFDFTSGSIIPNAVEPVYSFEKIPPAAGLIKNETILNGDVINTLSDEETLFPGEYSAFIINTNDESIEFIAPEYDLDPKCYDAIDRAPDWLSKDLLIKFRILSSANLDGMLAQLILDCEENVVDEVAFVIAHSSYQTLSASRFRQDIEVIVRNAEFIYNIVDSLKYVELVEYGNFEDKDYYTTTKYKIKNGANGSIEWIEAPKEIYYWYVVHPKIRQEGIYVQDNGTNNQQRTYGHFWRDYIWNNPNPQYDYRNVNKTTSKGSIDNIERFAERVMQAEILWDRQKTYFPFKRDYQAGDHALNIIGNWCSRAIPVDAVLPRAIQPNQALFEHNGNCGEDAYLIAAACRTALIPLIHRNTSCEDHALGAFWDNGWHHYEFFRGGLSERGNQFYGITNLLEGGSYGWTTSIVEGYRPDGYCENHTAEYTGLCTVDLTVGDVDGNPVDGLQVILFANPYAYGQGYYRAGQAWTNSDGNINFKVGAKSDGSGKTYAFQVYHPDFGIQPAEDQVWILINTPAARGYDYKATIKLQQGNMPTYDVTSNETPQIGDYGIHLNWDPQEIITGSIYDKDFPWDEFHYWNKETKGTVSFFLCDAENFDKHKSGQPFEAYEFEKDAREGDITLALPGPGEWYAIISNERGTKNLQHVEATCELLRDVALSAEDETELSYGKIEARPNPFSEKTTIHVDIPKYMQVKAELVDATGNLIQNIYCGSLAKGMHDFTIDGANLPEGMYMFRITGDGFVKSGKVICIK